MVTVDVFPDVSFKTIVSPSIIAVNSTPFTVVNTAFPSPFLMAFAVAFALYFPAKTWYVNTACNFSLFSFLSSVETVPSGSFSNALFEVQKQ